MRPDLSISSSSHLKHASHDSTWYRQRAVAHIHTRTPPRALKTSWVNSSKSLTFETKSNFTAKCNKSSRAPGHVWLHGDLRIILIRLQHGTTASRQRRLFWWMLWNKMWVWQEGWPGTTKQQRGRNKKYYVTLIVLRCSGERINWTYIWTGIKGCFRQDTLQIFTWVKK